MASAPGALATGWSKDYLLRLYLRDLHSASSDALDDSRAEGMGNSRGEAARDRLVLNHLPRVVRMAFDYRGFGLPLGDLISEGNLGLMRAAELYDPARNVRFTCYARPWIRVLMQRALSYQAWPVSFPADFIWRQARVQAAQERLEAAGLPDPNDKDLAVSCGLQAPAVHGLRSTPTHSFVPLDSPWPGKEPGLALAEMLADDTSPTPDQEAANHSDREFVEGLVAQLSLSEERVIRLRYGFEDGVARTLDEVGACLGRRRQSVHHLESKALGKLRRRLAGAGTCGVERRADRTPIARTSLVSIR